MEQNIAERVQKRMAELPEDVRQSIQSSNFDKKLQDIAAKHQLHIDQTGGLEDETLLVMMGFTEPAEFAKHIENQARVPQGKAQQIAGDVSQQIFLPIRESMKKFMDGQQKAVAPAPQPPMLPQTPPAPAPPPVPPSVPKPSEQKPPAYKMDPYREPPE